jgi:cysteinyl-tRNA synthetase
LNILEPHVWCRATDHIPEQIAFIQCIEANGYTYRTSDGIYFDTSRLPDYGYLARLDVEGLQAGARIDVGEKHSPTDFALWKFSPPGSKRQMEWDSPWGTGFPGWHIECSAMSSKYLGSFFDIHCGGEDHIPVHHANEIAQSQACHGNHLANFWLHGYFLQLGGAKMAKSAGGFLRLQDLADRGYDPLAFRFLCLTASYRAKLAFDWPGLDQAAASLDRLRAAAFEWGEPGIADERFLSCFQECIDDDLNMPRVLALTWELVHSDLVPAVKKATLLVFDRVLGLGLGDWQPRAEQIPPEVAALAQQRQQARQEKRWWDADALRDRIKAAGYEVQDTPSGPRLSKL